MPPANPIAVAATSDNLGKAVLDLLAAHRIIADDSLVARITAGWDSAVPAGVVRVTVEPAMAMASAEA